MKIAILGFGIVGRGIAEILLKKSTELTSKITIKKILIRGNRMKYYQNIIENTSPYNQLGKDIFTSEISDIIDDKEISIVVECIGGISPSYDYVISSLEAGKNIVTSNKNLLAEKYNELINNKKYFNRIKYESSVGGGIHIFHSIQNIKKVDKIKSFRGIVNGTTNYILSRMSEDNNLNFNDALKEAQELGYAEAEPSYDIDGHDACYKTILLYNEIFDKKIDVKDVKLKGIRNITKEDILNAKGKNKVIKLISYGDENEVFVKPVEIEKNDYLAHINGNFNCIIINSENLGVSSYIGQGAGKLATGHAIVLDIIDFFINN